MWPLFGLARGIRFKSPFSLEECLLRLRDQDEEEANDPSSLLARRIGVRFEVEKINSNKAQFTQFKQRLSVQNPFHTMRLGGVSVVGTINRGDDGTTSVIAASNINGAHAIISSASLILLSGLLVFFIPAMLLQIYEYPPIVALLVGGLLCVGAILAWTYLINRIVDELFKILKWTLHGYSLEKDVSG